VDDASGARRTGDSGGMHLSAALVRVPLAGLVLGLGALLAAGPGSAGPSQASGVTGDLAVLHAWDQARSRAYGRGDPAALRRLYLPRSEAGRADLAQLRWYAGRGLRVAHLTTQVLAAATLVRRPGRLRLRIVDRVAAGEALGRGRCWPMARDRARRRTVELRRVRGRWLVAGVTRR
jgi:hypothetical protein